MLSTHYRKLNLPGHRDLMRLIDYFVGWTAEVPDMELRANQSHTKTISSGNGNTRKFCRMSSFHKAEYEVVSYRSKD